MTLSSVIVDSTRATSESVQRQLSGARPANLSSFRNSRGRLTQRHDLQVPVAVERQAFPGRKCRQRVKALFRRACRVLCESRVFASLTTLLTLYALFGDDARLIFTRKAADEIFDWITIGTMIMFAIEIAAFCGGKAEYLWGFFFWLDIIATVTLVADVTTVGELLFGDSISTAMRDDAGDQSTGGGSGGSGGDGGEATRAARMSRAGTRAGRVVRLIRLLRLVKMLKVLKKDDKNRYNSFPGEDWDDDDEEHQVQESAVSKKLSEMTTRRVIVLVLLIMLFLPVFNVATFLNRLDSSGQYGINVIYRQWCDDMQAFGASSGPLARAAYLQSTDRQVYEDALLQYIYKHNWFAHSVEVPSGKSSPQDNFNRLFWLGANPIDAPEAEFLLPGLTGSQLWNERWAQADWDYFSGEIPEEVVGLLTAPWSESGSCVRGRYRGISLIQFEEDEIRCPEELRYQERTALYPQWATEAELERMTFLFVFDRRAGSITEAMLNLFQTLFICFLLSIGSLTFANDANKLVLAPIERMIFKLEKIRNDPLEALKIKHGERQLRAGRQKTGDEERCRDYCKRCLVALLPCCARSLGAANTQVPEPMETQVLERTIIRIASLLAIGFGAAGAQIVGQNMKDNDSSAIMGVIPGTKVEGIFAYCRIDDFSSAVEGLQDHVTIFVNGIASIVHSCVDEFFGNPNKNVGDAFLLVWRLSGQPPDKRCRLADMSLVALTRIVDRLACNWRVAQYRGDVRLLRRLPGYRVRLRFGLHCGWAIEGAIGSEFKIDASYISPQVDTASALQSLASDYRCFILASGALVDMLSQGIKDECRLIDNIVLAEDRRGVRHKLYTLDLDDLVLQVEERSEVPTTGPAKAKARWLRHQQKHERWSDDYQMHQVFLKDMHINAMRAKFSEEFYCRFAMAYANYEAGNWPVAMQMLEVTRALVSPDDGPSDILLRYMALSGGVAPAAWSGHRLVSSTNRR